MKLESPPYHACWYLITLGSEIAPGQVVSVEFLGGSVVVYHSECGVSHVHSAYCRHLGADLALGKVAGENRRCAFHGWECDDPGRCTLIPAGDKVPPRARLFAYPTAESLGIIWAFNGSDPTSPVPTFSEDPAAADSFRNPQAMGVSSDVVFLNTFDQQQFRVVH